MPTEKLEFSTQSIFYELQALRKIYETLAAEFSIVDTRLSRTEGRQEKVFTTLYTGNGDPSLQEQVRTIATKLDNLITSIETERNLRKKAEAEFRSKMFWVIF